MVNKPDSLPSLNGKAHHREDTHADPSLLNTATGAEANAQAPASSTEEQGYQEATLVQGRLSSLGAHLDALFQHHQEEMQQHQHEQAEAKQPYLESTAQLNTQKQEQQTKKDQMVKRLERHNRYVSALKEEKHWIRNNPDKWLNPVVNTNARIRFILGLGILVMLTAYLGLFYSSASFSAFFRQFDTGVQVTQTIFDPATLAKAYEHLLSGLFITTIPVVFLALGYLIHQFSRNGQDPWRYLKISGLVTVTFFFDALLAYEIELKQYTATQTINDPPFGPVYAVSSPEFWLILFAGFVVYIVWGLTLSFTLNEMPNMDAMGQTLLRKDRDIEAVNAQLEADREALDQIERSISATDAQIQQNQAALQRVGQLPLPTYDRLHADYLKGWIAYLASNNCSESELQQAHTIADVKLAEFKGEPAPKTYDDHGSA